jgi:hypothetical protein
LIALHELEEIPRPKRDLHLIRPKRGEFVRAEAKDLKQELRIHVFLRGLLIDLLKARVKGVEVPDGEGLKALLGEEVVVGESQHIN